ncbi:spore germination protein [Paenibacillus algorifonticola]|uniref:Spore germination protein n=1 Tax=Paenibacillus algorifonticola TaxID=684063 RepID=A0A1I2FS03_9BACL|nr:Ger(x)C family spore germination protein [Paenibacillus algorifonticola]SFF07783.1 spore germination protein [Paenibacillus algorifonticola]
MQISARNRSALLLIIVFPLLLAGCWDRNEIEETGIALGIGIDFPDEQEKGARPIIAMTHQFALPNQFSESTSSKVQKDYVNMSSKGPIVFDNIRELSTRSARPPNYEHLQVIVISEKAARAIDLKNVINFFLRNTETRRSIRVVLSHGKASDIFQQQKSTKTPALELRELTDNYRKTLRIPPPLTLGNMSEHLTGQSSFVMQSAASSPEGAKLSGGAVIKGTTARMIGFLSETETVGVNWLLGGNHSNGIVEGVEPNSGAMLGYEVRKITSSIQPIVQGDNISFRVKIKTTGKLREDWAFPGDAFDADFINRAEQATAAKIKQIAEKALAKTQRQYKVDVAHFGKRLSIKQPAVWKRVKDGWEERFSRMPVSIEVEVDIQEFGTRGTKRN